MMRTHIAPFCALLLSASFGSSPAWSDERGLKAVIDALSVVRATPGAEDLRYAGPGLTPLKHSLRAWVETQLPQSIKQLPEIERQLNIAINANKLDETGQESAVYDNKRGSIDEVRLSRLDGGRYILVKTGIGIECGYDQSAYVYERNGKGWRLLFQNEQDQYRPEHYKPQAFLSVSVAPARKGARQSAPLVMTLGHSWTCASFWQDLYVRLSQPTPLNPASAPLLDTTETYYIEPTPKTWLTPRSLTVSFEGRGEDDRNVHITRRYRITSDGKVTRLGHRQAAQ